MSNALWCGRTFRTFNVLDCYVFETLGEVRRTTADWIVRYNESRNSGKARLDVDALY
jgi:hypothetical protein